MKVETKTLARANWGRILARRSAFGEVHTERMDAVAELLLLEKTAKPLVTTVLGQHLTIVDDGYAWLQVAPRGENWWLSVMFDADRNLIQYYFDVTRKNVLAGCDSYFEDLFLDVVALPTGKVTLLDEDELEQALAEGVITEAEAVLARETAARLLAGVPQNIKKLEAFCQRLLCELKPKLQ